MLARRLIGCRAKHGAHQAGKATVQLIEAQRVHPLPSVYNTRYSGGLHGVLITIPANGTILDNTLERMVGKYREDYRWGLHEIIPPNDVAPQDRPSTTRFQVSFGAAHNGRSFLRSTECAGRLLDIGAWSHYVTGQATLTEGSAPRP